MYHWQLQPASLVGTIVCVFVERKICSRHRYNANGFNTIGLPVQLTGNVGLRPCHRHFKFCRYRVRDGVDGAGDVGQEECLGRMSESATR